MRNVLKCSTGHTFFTVKFWHFSSAAFIEKKRRTGTYASLCNVNNAIDNGMGYCYLPVNEPGATTSMYYASVCLWTLYNFVE